MNSRDLEFTRRELLAGAGALVGAATARKYRSSMPAKLALPSGVIVFSSASNMRRSTSSPWRQVTWVGCGGALSRLPHPGDCWPAGSTRAGTSSSRLPSTGCAEVFRTVTSSARVWSPVMVKLFSSATLSPVHR